MIEADHIDFKEAALWDLQKALTSNESGGLCVQRAGESFLNQHNYA